MAKPKIDPPFKKRIYKKAPPVIPFKQGTDLVGFMQSWVASPEYEKRIKNNNYTDPNKIINNRLSALSNLSFTYDNSIPNVTNAPATPTSTAFININKDEANRLGATVDSVKAHELSHAVGAKQGTVNKNIGFNKTESDLLKDSIIRKQSSNSNYRHLLNPEEIKADLDASRYNLFNGGIYDIRKGEPFTKQHLDKAKGTFKNDGSFNRLLKQVGDDNYINLMNTIASNDQDNVTMAKFGGKINPMQEQYFLGGALGQGFTPGSASGATGMGLGMLSGLIPQQDKQGLTSVAGSTATGALQGASAGATLGPWGLVGGAVLGGGMSLINAQEQREEEQRAIQLQKDNTNREMLANMNYGVGQSSNLPMAMGGKINPMGSFTIFENGGTHEANPNGGIPQGFNNEGKQITVEEGESKFKFKDSDYVFSNRLKF